MYYMSFVNTDSESPSRMSVFVNASDKICIEIVDEQDPEDIYRYQSTTLNKEDLIALIKELERLAPQVK